MTLPKPEAGLVVRYSYLWLREHLEGREEGTKDRPCAIILAAHDHDGETQVLVIPVTHSPPGNSAAALELPPAVKQHLGLDAERSWVVLSEAICSTGLVPICAASAIVTTVRSRTDSCRRGSSPNCGDAFSLSKPPPVQHVFSGQNKFDLRPPSSAAPLEENHAMALHTKTVNLTKGLDHEEPAPEPFSQNRRPEIGRFRLQVDRQTKASFTTYEAAEQAGMVIKKAHPVVRVAIYDAVESINRILGLPEAK